MTIAPLTRTVQTKAAPPRAFELFTAHMGKWWPRGMTVGANPHTDIVIEPFVDGRWYERDDEGQETDWGKVLVWAPSERLVLGWQLDAQFKYNADFLTEVELSFEASENGGTTVTLEHRNLERFGAEAAVLAGKIDGGWGRLLGTFADYVDTLT